jgi:rhodanese-related sulfurtransferase
MKNKFIAGIAGLLLAATVSGQATNKKTQVTLSVDSFAAKINRQTKPQLIDARGPEEFAFNHIEGAINFNLQSADYAGSVQLLNKNRPVFIYSIQTVRSGALAKDLQNKGFTEVYDLKGGIANWVGSGWPYYTSSKKGLTLAAFNNILATNKLVLADIGSRYCGTCKKVKPVLDSLRKENGDAVKIIEIDLEESPALIAQLKTVDVFPYLILYKQGDIALKRSGLNALKTDIDAAIAKAK